MSTINIENGTTIDKLKRGTVNETTSFLGTTDNLTLNIPIDELRKAFAYNGAGDDRTSMFYPVSDIDKKIDEIRLLINTDYSGDVYAINNKIDALQKNINAELLDVKKQVKRLLDATGLQWQ